MKISISSTIFLKSHMEDLVKHNIAGVAEYLFFVQNVESSEQQQLFCIHIVILHFKIHIFKPLQCSTHSSSEDWDLGAHNEVLTSPETKAIFRYEYIYISIPIVLFLILSRLQINSYFPRGPCVPHVCYIVDKRYPPLPESSLLKRHSDKQKCQYYVWITSLHQIFSFAI